MRIQGGNTLRCGRPALAGAVVLSLVATASGAAHVFPSAQQAIIDSLQVLNRTAGAEAVAAVVTAHLPAARAAADTHFVMRLLGMRGAARVWHEEIRGARGDLTEALALARTVGDSLSVARNLLWLARALELEGSQAASGAAYRQLVAVGQFLDSPYHLGRGLVGLAWDRMVVADYAAAESLYIRGCAYAEAARDTFGLRWGQNGLGLCRWNTGRTAAADSLFQLVLAGCRGRSMVVIEAAALNNRAGLMEVLGRPDEALRGYQAAWDLQRQAGNLRETVPAAMNVARCLHQLGQLDAAAAAIEQSRDACQAAGFRDQLPMTAHNLAEIRQAQGRPALASRICREAMRERDVLRPRVEVRLALTLAGALAAQDSLEAALTVARAAAALPDARENVAMRAEVALVLGSLLIRTARPAEAAAILDDAAVPLAAAGLVSQRLSLLTAAGDAYLLAGRPAAARVRLLAAMDLWEPARGLLDEPIWRERRTASARRLFEALAELALAGPDSLPAAERAARCFDLLQHYKARTLFERTFGPGRTADVPRPVTLAELQSAVLRPGEVFADAYVGERGGLVFVVTRDTLLVEPLRDRAAVAVALSVVEGQLAEPSGPEPGALARLLAASLVDPRRPGLPPADLRDVLARAVSVCWAPDGELHRLPLVLLLESREVPVARTPSATFLAALRRQPPAADRGAARVLAAAGLTDGRGQPLPGAAAEVAWLAGRFAGVVAVVDSTASAPFGGQDPAIFDLLHVAAHAETDAERPWNCALVFGAPGSPARLRAGEVADLRLSARLAVLASCGSAGGALISGEGMVGPAAGFLAAGVPTVLATLWPVADRDALAFTQRFYGELADGCTAAVALQRTQQWLRGRPQTARPASWAGYVLLGESQQTVALAERPSVATWLGVAGGVVGAAAAILAARRRRRQRSSVKPQVDSSPSASSLTK